MTKLNEKTHSNVNEKSQDYLKLIESLLKRALPFVNHMAPSSGMARELYTEINEIIEGVGLSAPSQLSNKTNE